MIASRIIEQSLLQDQLYRFKRLIPMAVP